MNRRRKKNNILIPEVISGWTAMSILKGEIEVRDAMKSLNRSRASVKSAERLRPKMVIPAFTASFTTYVATALAVWAGDADSLSDLATVTVQKVSS